MRISARLTRLYPLSRRAAKEAVNSGLVTLDGSTVRKDEDVNGGILEYKGKINTPDFRPEDYIISRNPETVFIYKPPFMHSERLRPSDGLTVSDIMEKLKPYKSVSRLDYEADGIIGAVKAGTEIKNMRKSYIAIVSGRFPDALEADWFIDADKKRRVKIIENGKGNKTAMKRLAEKNGFSLIEAVLEKAARHQIRAFCAHAGYPILGDKIYGGQEFSRLCLHCESVSINGFSAGSGDFALKFAAMID